MTKSEVLTMLGISNLDKEIAENTLELCGMNPIQESSLEYDSEEVCRFYAKAATFFREYLPEFYVSEILGINVDELLNMNIEYMLMPAEMQCLFYDSYPKGKFRYSKYVYNAIQVYKVLDVLSKSIFLKIPTKIPIYYKKSFVSSEAAVSALGFTKVNPALYHFYLMKLDIRYTCYQGEKKYLIDDICNTLEKANEVYDKYISFYEACELYGYYTIRFLCNKFSLLAYTGSLLKYDVVFSDTRFKYAFRDSQSFLVKKDVQKMYLEWFKRSAGEIFYGLKVINRYEPKFECDWDESHSYTENAYGFELSQPSVSVFEQSSFSIDELRGYEHDPEYENLDLLCKIWGLDVGEYNLPFEQVLRHYKIESYNESTTRLYCICDFAHQYERAVLYNTLTSLNIKTLETEEYFNLINKKDSQRSYAKTGIISSPNWLRYIIRNSKKYVSINIVKHWNKVVDYRCNPHKDYIIHENQQYISYAAHRRQCLRNFYTSKLFDLHSSDSGRAEMHINLDFTCLYNTNNHLRKLIYNDFKAAIFLKDLYPSQMAVTFLQCKNSSTIKVCETLDKSREYWPVIKVITYLNLDKYSITLTWGILYNLELSMVYYREDLYMVAEDVISIKNSVTDLLTEHIPVRNLYYLLHKSHPIIKLTDEIIAPPGMFYFLMPENNRGFYLIKKISLKLLDEAYNERVNCGTLLTAAEVQGNLHMLPSKITITLAIHLLHIDHWIDELGQTYSLYADNSKVFCKRDAIIKLVELQKVHQEIYVLEDHIPKFLKIDIDGFSKKDRELLETISVYKAPDYIMYMSENKNLTNDRAYRKEDVLGLREFFHVSRNTRYDVKVDNNVTCEVPYQTYSMRLAPLGIRENFEQISPTSAYIWDDFVRLQLSVQQCSKKSLNSKINRYIKALNILMNMLQDNEISEISEFQTSAINRNFKSIGSVTYSGILLGFFKYAAVVYADRGIKQKYRPAELAIPKTEKENPDNILPEIYSFAEYSKLFNYCNDYYVHIEIAVNEILEFGTCTYASTWFYIMSHLNNAWRSNDFAMFPYIDILDIVHRNTSNDIKWYLNNRIAKSDATIIALRIQNNPKVISKTRKYTRFTCSDELLQTYTTVYSLLALYTSNYLCYDIGFVTHFGNKYNGTSKLQLEHFFSKFGMINFRFKSRKLNKTLLSMIDFLENYYIVNDIDIERRQAMLLRSHVKPSSTAYYIQKSKEVFDRLTNMICARGEFGYAYEMMVRSIMDAESKLSLEEMTDRIRKIRYMIPNMKDIDIVYGFLNYTHQEQSSLNEYLHSLSLEELQTKLAKLYLNRLGSKTDKYLPCIKDTCQNSHGRRDECAYCVFHIPSIYSLTVICQSIKEDINCYSNTASYITRKKIISKLFKKSRDIMWARQKYGDDVLQEVLAISGTDYDQFLLTLKNFLITQEKIEQIAGGKINA